MKRILALLLVLSALLALAACSKTPAVTEDEGTTLVYGSGDYTRINPAMDEHGEINVLLFSGLTAHNGSNEVVAGLAESWEYDESACTYTFHLRDGVKWHGRRAVHGCGRKIHDRSHHGPRKRLGKRAEL